MIGALFVVGSLLGNVEGDPSASPSSEDRLFPSRVDAQPEDQERELEKPALISDVAATVYGYDDSSVAPARQGHEVVVMVFLKNLGEETAHYSWVDWKIQSPSGRVDDATFLSDSMSLGSGDLVADGHVIGRIALPVLEAGSYYVIWKPEAFDSARGIWRIRL